MSPSITFSAQVVLENVPPALSREPQVLNSTVLTTLAVLWCRVLGLAGQRTEAAFDGAVSERLCSANRTVGRWRVNGTGGWHWPDHCRLRPTSTRAQHPHPADQAVLLPRWPGVDDARLNKNKGRPASLFSFSSRL